MQGRVRGHGRVRPSFLGFHRLMKALRDHADAGVQQPYGVPYLSEYMVMNSHSLIDPLVAGCLVGDTRK